MRVRADDGCVQTDGRLIQTFIVLGAVGILIGLDKKVASSFRSGVFNVFSSL